MLEEDNNLDSLTADIEEAQKLISEAQFLLRRTLPSLGSEIQRVRDSRELANDLGNIYYGIRDGMIYMLNDPIRKGDQLIGMVEKVKKLS